MSCRASAADSTEPLRTATPASANAARIVRLPTVRAVTATASAISSPPPSRVDSTDNARDNACLRITPPTTGSRS